MNGYPRFGWVDILRFQHPADVEQNLSLFTGMLADNLHADKNMAKNLLDGVEAYAKNHKIVYSHLMLNVKRYNVGMPVRKGET